MPRTVSATTQTEIAKSVTRPIYLVELEFSPTLYLSTGGEVEWNSITWQASRVRVEGPRLTGQGSQEGRLSFFYSADMYALIFGQGVAEKACKIYQLYGDGPYAVGDAVQLFEGIMDGASADANSLTIGYASEGYSVSFAPRILVNQVTNYLTPSGTKITFGGQVYVLEGR